MSSASTVRVTFVDAATDAVIGEVELPVEQLPETFARPTTLDLGGTDWQVEHAEPVSRPEFAALGKLRIVMREIRKVDPQEILFSIPTIENTMAPLCEGDIEGAFQMHEDDWRQRELVSGAFKAEIESELIAVRAVHAESTNHLFRRLHVRERIPLPLTDVGLTLQDVRTALDGAIEHPLAIGQMLVSGGFAFEADGAVVYGHAQTGAIVALGVTNGYPACIADLARAKELLLVDWCRASVLTG